MDRIVSMILLSIYILFHGSLLKFFMKILFQRYPKEMDNKTRKETTIF